MSWKDKQLIGFSVKSMEELERAAMTEVNMVEIRADKFKKNGFPLYFFENGKFILQKSNLANLSSIAHAWNMAVQFHLPIEKNISAAGEGENVLNIGIKNHHDAYLLKFLMFEEIYRKYRIGKVLTVHPPLVSVKGKNILRKNRALNNAKIFFDRLDTYRMRESHNTEIGVENQSMPKKMAGNLGYETEHFKIMLRDTRTIGITIDTGHRRLTEGFKVSDFMKLGFPVVNCHFHGNPGIINPKNFDDDTHEFPRGKNGEQGENVKGYWNYIRYFRRHRNPITLEIAHLEKYTDRELSDLVARIKRETE